VSLSDLRALGAFVKPTGKRGRPQLSAGSQNRLGERVAFEVQLLIEQDKRSAGRITRAVNTVAASRRLSTDATRQMWKRHPLGRCMAPSANLVLAIQGRLAWLPPDVADRLLHLPIRELMELVHDDNFATAAFCADIRALRFPGS
jgi:hypothetical protein